MCDEREQLIAYVYGETAVSERQQIEAHLGECHVCRAEVSGLRGVRDDLLAWDVPKHEPIWRPFVPAPPVPARASWPAWALATAAGILFTAGLAGGMAVRGGLPDARPSPTAAALTTTGMPTAERQTVPAVTAEDLARVEAAILERVRTEMTERMRTSVPSASEARLAAIERRMDEQEEWRDDQISLNALFNGQIGRVNSRTSNLSERLELSRLQRVGLDGGSQ